MGVERQCYTNILRVDWIVLNWMLVEYFCEAPLAPLAGYLQRGLECVLSGQARNFMTNFERKSE